MRDPATFAATVEMLTWSTELLDRDVTRLDGDALAQACALQGWTRAHLITHLARNADGLRNLLLAARAGLTLRMYANPRARVADIDAGASRPADVIVDDLLESDRRFAAEVIAMPSDGWDAAVAFTSGQPDPPTVSASEVLLMRLNEVVIHHADLAAEFGFGDVREDIARTLIHRYERRYANQGIAVSAIEGPLAERLSWLAGRGGAGSLRAPGNAPVPTLPSLG